MNKNTAQDRLCEILGDLYWHESGVEWGRLDPEKVKLLEAERVAIIDGLNNDRYPPERNERGNRVERSHWGEGERYAFDFCGLLSDWRQYDTDQDAWYFGVWVNLETYQILTYAEGDITLITCDTLASFTAEIDSMDSFYVNQPPAAVAITNDGRREEWYDPRPRATQAPATPAQALTLDAILAAALPTDEKTGELG